MEYFWYFLSQFRALLDSSSLALIPAAIMLLSAIAAVVLRNLFHCALFLTLSFVALSVLFIALGAQFIGFAQIMVYVGAVAVLIVFAILLTHPDRVEADGGLFGDKGTVAGAIVSYLVFVALLVCIFFSPATQDPNSRTIAEQSRLPEYYVRATQWQSVKPRVRAPVELIGANLMTNYMVPLQATGVLLTAALIGAALLAKEEKPS